jgi:hypothetical protein
VTEKEQRVAILTQRQRAYAKVFSGEDAASAEALSDLKRFCRHAQSCFHPDPRVHAALEGRREVMLRIMDFCELSVEQLYKKYHGDGGIEDAE